MKKKPYYLLLAVIITATLALLGVAVGFWVLRPYASYHSTPRTLPENGIPDYLFSAVFLALAGLVCFVGGQEITDLDYDEQAEDGGGTACP